MSGPCQPVVDVALLHHAADHDVAGPVLVQQRRTGLQRLGRLERVGERFPRHGKMAHIKRGNRLALAHHHGNGFTTKPRNAFGKHRLIGKWQNGAVDVGARNIRRGHHRDKTGMSVQECGCVANLKAGVMVRRADQLHHQGIRRNAVGAELLAAIDLGFAIDPADRLADGVS